MISYWSSYGDSTIAIFTFSIFNDIGGSAFEAPGVGLEPTSLGRHQLSYFMILEADPF